MSAPIPHADKRECGAKLKRPGVQNDWRCHRAPMPNGKCYRHGGATPAGIASPLFKDGRQSKYLKCLSGDLAKHFDPDSPRLIELTEELALLDAGIKDLLERAKHPAGGIAQWQEALASFTSFEKARDAKQGKAAVQALKAHGALLKAGAAAQQGLNEAILPLMEMRIKASAVESRRRKDEHDMVDRAEFKRFTKVFLLQMRQEILALALDPAVARGVMMRVQEGALRILAISQGPLLAGELG